MASIGRMTKGEFEKALEERRMVRVRIGAHDLYHNTDAVQDVLKRVVVLISEYTWDMHSHEYLVCAPMFDPVSECVKAPRVDLLRDEPTPGFVQYFFPQER